MLKQLVVVSGTTAGVAKHCVWFLVGLAVIFGSVRPIIAEDAAAQVVVLISQLRTGSPQAQVSAADQLGRLSDAARPAVSALFDAMTGKSTWVDIAMMEALGKLGPIALPFLLEQFQNGEPGIRARALRGMWGMGVALKNYRQLLQKATEDKNENVRQMARRVLQNLDDALAMQTNVITVA